MEAQPRVMTEARDEEGEAGVDGNATSATEAECRDKKRVLTNIPSVPVLDAPPCCVNGGVRHGWKPVTTKKRVLVPFALTCFALAGAIEFLAQRSFRQGGLALVPSADELPGIVTFTHEYLPTIIGALLNLWWNWVDLDIKRIHPWFELSRPGGATAQNSILVDYPFDFIAFVPFQALKRKHWNVFISGLTMVFMFYGILPFLSSIFGTETVVVTRPATFQTTSQLLPVEAQAAELDSMLLNTASSIKYLNQQYPPFTTAEYALAPFSVRDLGMKPAESWTSTTVKYYADLDCWPAAEQKDARTPNTYHFDNGRGCNATDQPVKVSSADQVFLGYLGYYSDAHAIYSFGTPKCHDGNPERQFLLIAAIQDNSTETGLAITSLFCEPRFWQQDVVATVSVKGFVPVTHSISPLGAPQPLPDTVFNFTGLNYVLGAGVSSVSQIRDYPDATLQSLEVHVKDSPVRTPYYPAVPFAISDVVDQPLADWLDASFLHDRFEAVHQTMFALAYRNLQVDSDSSTTNTIQGTQVLVLHGVRVSRVFSAIVESMLYVIGASAILLHILCRRYTSNLTSDPASIGDIMSMMHSDSAILSLLAEKDFCSEKQLRKALETSALKFKLQPAWQSPSGSPTLLAFDDTRDRPTRDPLLEHQAASPATYLPVKPWILRREIGSLFMASLAGIFAAIIFLWVRAEGLGGLPRPTENFDLLQLLTEYIPTAIGSLIEPYWILVTRMLCLLQPFTEMRNGLASAQTSVQAPYTSIPPQLVFIKAMMQKHFMLAMVCIISGLSSVLTVGFGGMFTEKLTHMTYPLPLKSSTSGRFNPDELDAAAIHINGHFFADHFLTIYANATQNATLPPWATERFYFLPFTKDDGSLGGAAGAITGRTSGYGANITCEAIPATSNPLVVDLTDFQNKYLDPSGDCTRTITPYGAWGPSISGGRELSGPLAVEIVFTEACSRVTVSMYTRFPSQPSEDGLPLTRGNFTDDTTVVACYLGLQTAEFDVTVDHEGRVLRAEQVTEGAAGLGHLNDENDAHAILELSLLNWGGMGGLWHNETLATNWMDWLIKAVSNSDEFLDPRKPRPSADFVIRHQEEIYRRHLPLVLAYNDRVFATTDDLPTFEGTAVLPETRIFVSKASFVVSLAILIPSMLAAAALYGFSIKFFLPRMPTTIASIIAYLASSRAVRLDADRISREKYAFGRYIDTSGRFHVGIELSKFVRPVKTRGPMRGDYDRAGPLLPRLRARVGRKGAELG